MTDLLERAFSEATKLPESEQNWLARRILAELESERQWEELFENSQDVLGRLAEEALTEYREGKTQILDVDCLRVLTRPKLFGIGVVQDGDIVWFWIGPHREYEKLLTNIG